MDLILGRFADAYLRGMDKNTLALFAQLLDQPDPEIFDWVMGVSSLPRWAKSPDALQLARALKEFNQ